jgi:spore coat polysaccharide biosynthesis protein SpsF
MNEQELFWKGEFGDEYVDRNQGLEFVAAKIDMFSKALNVTGKINSIIELGANRGLNADALKLILPESSYVGVEIGDKAFSFLEKNPNVDECHHASIHEFSTDNKYDLAMIAGVMIHLNPNTLPDVYRLLADLSSRYVLISEYYNPTPVEIKYRGHTGKLFKRDFAKEFMDETGYNLVDYGFVYRNDPKFRHDDMTWFLLEK